MATLIELAQRISELRPGDPEHDRLMAIRRSRLEHRDDVVAKYKEAEKAFEEAKRAVSRYVLEESGLALGQLARVTGGAVYEVRDGSGWINPFSNAPQMVLTVRRFYRGGRTAASSSTVWASSLTPLTAEEDEEWRRGDK